MNKFAKYDVISGLVMIVLSTKIVTYVLLCHNLFLCFTLLFSSFIGWLCTSYSYFVLKSLSLACQCVSWKVHIQHPKERWYSVTYLSIRNDFGTLLKTHNSIPKSWCSCSLISVNFFSNGITFPQNLTELFSLVSSRFCGNKFYIFKRRLKS